MTGTASEIDLAIDSDVDDSVDWIVQDGKIFFRNPPGSLPDMYFRMSEDLRGAYWVRDQVLEENEALRRENRMWKLNAVMGWATIPYPNLRPEDFDGLERQPW